LVNRASVSIAEALAGYRSKMSGTQVFPIGLRFGAELEVVTGSRSKAHTDWHHTASELSKELERNGVRNHVNHSRNKDEEDYSEWSVIQEATVTSHPKTNRCKPLSFSTQHYILYTTNLARRGYRACLTHLGLPTPFMEPAHGCRMVSSSREVRYVYQ
jgi:hypothetical protein